MSLKPTCREVHRLTSEALDRELSPVEYLRMKAHLLVCRACRTFNAQTALLRRAMRSMKVPSGDESDQQ